MEEAKPVPESEFMRIKRAAEYLDCSEWLIWKKLTAGRLKRYSFDNGGLTYVKRAELDELMREAH